MAPLFGRFQGTKQVNAISYVFYGASSSPWDVLIETDLVLAVIPAVKPGLQDATTPIQHKNKDIRADLCFKRPMKLTSNTIKPNTINNEFRLLSELNQPKGTSKRQSKTSEAEKPGWNPKPIDSKRITRPYNGTSIGDY